MIPVVADADTLFAAPTRGLLIQLDYQGLIRLRRAAFSCKGSKLAIERIQETLAAIRTVARQDPATAAEGAVLFLEKPPRH